MIAEMSEGQATQSSVYMVSRCDTSVQRIIASAHNADSHYSTKHQDSLSKTAREENHTARNVLSDTKTKTVLRIWSAPI
jgi:hypothetical protein